jgi:hypothetical protein
MFPYPATENWQKAIGAHVVWLSAVVGATEVDGAVQFSMSLTVHAEDRYNFNPGAHDIATGIPDGANGIFEVTGLARQYMHYSTLQRSVVWREGDRSVGSVSSVQPARVRQPQDNRRIRNRL